MMPGPKVRKLLQRKGPRDILSYIADQDSEEGTYLSEIARALDMHINTVWKDLQKMQEYQGDDPERKVLEVHEDGSKFYRATPQGISYIQKLKKEKRNGFRNREGEPNEA